MKTECLCVLSVSSFKKHEICLSTSFPGQAKLSTMPAGGGGAAPAAGGGTAAPAAAAAAPEKG